MSRGISILVVCLGGLWKMCSLCGQTVSASGTGQHVTTVSFSVAVMQTNEAKRDFSVLEIKFAPRQKQLESLSREIDDLRKQLNDQRDKLSDSELNARSQALASKQKQLERSEADYRSDSQSEGEEAFRRIAQKLFEFLQSYARDRGYTIVIDRVTENIPVVLYATQEADITDELISAYNAKSGIPTPALNGGNGPSPGASSLHAPEANPRRP